MVIFGLSLETCFFPLEEQKHALFIRLNLIFFFGMVKFSLRCDTAFSELAFTNCEVFRRCTSMASYTTLENMFLLNISQFQMTACLTFLNFECQQSELNFVHASLQAVRICACVL